jgi:5-methylcytosine-specific restriction endonuclease McrA
VDQAEQQVLGADVVVAEQARLFLGQDHNAASARGELLEHARQAMPLLEEPRPSRGLGRVRDRELALHGADSRLPLAATAAPLPDRLRVNAVPQGGVPLPALGSLRGPAADPIWAGEMSVPPVAPSPCAPKAQRAEPQGRLLEVPDAEVASGFAERVLSVIDEGRRTATYKLALLLAILDAVAEGVDAKGLTPPALNTRVVAAHVARLYWPQVRPFPAEDRGPVELRQITNKQATILRAVAEVHTQASVRTWDDAERVAPSATQRALDAVELTVARYPLLRLQTVDGAPRPFIYDVDWNEHVSLAALHRLGGGRVVFRPGAAGELIRIAPLIRPLVELHWVRMVGHLNGLMPVEDTLRAHLFGADRVGFSVQLRVGLGELQANECFYCHERLSGVSAVDHFLPWSRWPNDAVENLVLAHGRCNTKKSDHIAGLGPLREWRGRLDGHGGALAELARRTNTVYRPARTLALARSLYGYLSPGAPLWDGPGVVSQVENPAEFLTVLADRT